MSDTHICPDSLLRTTKWENVVELRPTKQIKALLALLRDQTTERDDFVFYSDRLIRLVIEEGLSLLPFEDVDITTPTQTVVKGALAKLPNHSPQ